MQHQMPLLDTMKRPITDLRISVTDQCNFRCRYCMPAEIFGPNYPFLKRDQILSNDEWIRLVQIFSELGVRKVRLTGGEPLLRADLAQLIARLIKIKGLDDIALTTNGSLLSKQAKALKEAGLKRITVSLDSLQDEHFSQMNGVKFPVQRVLDGIQEAAQVGLKIKINMVVQKGVNDEDILPMARYFKDKGHTLRFIEYMDVGNSNDWRMDQVLPFSQIYKRIHQELPLQALSPQIYGEVAKRYRYVGTDTEIGFISSISKPFCSTCTRARLSAEGCLYTCLFASKGYDLRESIRSDASDEQIKLQISHIWQARADRYSEERSQHTKRNKVEMSYIGG